MKRVYLILTALLSTAFVFTACNNEAPFSTASSDDDPRILDPVFPNRENGALPIVSTIGRDANFTMEVTVTPADYTTVVWFIDGAEVNRGTEIDLALNAGTYNLKIVASTDAGKSTSREALLKINPLAADPSATTKAVERIVSPDGTARLYGTNLDKVSSIVIGDNAITDITYNATDGYVEYTVPADLADGEHRVVFTDAEGNEYGGDKIVSTSSALVTAGAERTNAGKEWVMTGMNLDNVTSLNLGDVTIDESEFIRKSANEIAITTPDLADGEYAFSGTTADNEAVRFYLNGTFTEKCTVVISSETILWQGHHYVSWEYADGNPNKTFNLIPKETFASMSAGSTLSIHYTLEPGAVSPAMQTTTVWWTDLPGTSTTSLTADGVHQIILTQEGLDLIQAQDGFLCVGHGYYVDMVTIL